MIVCFKYSITQETHFTLFKPHLWIMWFCGYCWDLKKYSLMSGRRLTIAMRGWALFVFLGVTISWLLLLVPLILNFGGNNFWPFLMEFGGVTNGLFMMVWFHYKSESQAKLCIAIEEEYLESPQEYYWVKMFSRCYMALQFFSPTVCCLITFVQFLSEEYVQYFYDSMNSFSDVKVSTSLSMFRLGAIGPGFILFVVAIGILNGFGMGILYFVFIKRYFDKVLSFENYECIDDLKRKRENLSKVGHLVRLVNDCYSLPLLVIITTAIIQFCMSVVNFFGGISIDKGFHFNCTMMISLAYGLSAIPAAACVLFIDQKTDPYVRKVYEISAQRDPNDIDFAIHADALAQQMKSTKVFARLWKFHKMNRMTLLQLYSSICSYVFLVVDVMPGLLNRILGVENEKAMQD